MRNLLCVSLSALIVCANSVLAQTVTPPSITIANTSPVCSGASSTESACITLPPESTLNKVDVFFLFDDTGSFAGFVPSVTTIFSSLVSDLQTALPGVEFGFGVGRFEDYGGPGADYSGEDLEGRPFTLNQPIVTVATAGDATQLDTLISTALNNTAPGFGGDGPETAIAEGLFQIATGVGFDGDGDSSTTGTGGLQTAGSLDAQVNSDQTGDVPAISTADGSVVKSGTIGGVGFRSGALKLVIMATDICSVAAFDSATGIPTDITGAGGNTIPTLDLACSSTPGSARFGFVGDSKSEATNTIPNAVAPLGAATVPQTIAALNAAGIRVIGMGPGASPQPVGSGPSFGPSVLLSALARLTGAVDTNGDPLVFSISGGGEPLKDAIVNAVLNAVTLPVDISLQPDSNKPTQLAVGTNPAVALDVPPGGQACFDVTFVSDGSFFSGAFGLDFVEAGSSSVLGSVPVGVDCSLKEVLCKQSDVSSALFTMDGNSHGMQKLVKSAANLLKKAGGSKSFANAAVAQAQTLHNTAWNLTWKISPKPLDCGTTSLCGTVSTSASTSGYLDATTQLKALLSSVTAKLKKAKGGKYKTKAKFIDNKGTELLNAGQGATKALPATESSCGTGVTVKIQS